MAEELKGLCCCCYRRVFIKGKRWDSLHSKNAVRVSLFPLRLGSQSNNTEWEKKNNTDFDVQFYLSFSFQFLLIITGFFFIHIVNQRKACIFSYWIFLCFHMVFFQLKWRKYIWIKAYILQQLLTIFIRKKYLRVDRRQQ
jgi:hypothetical protein